MKDINFLADNPIEFFGLETNQNLVLKPSKYVNSWIGITEPQRRIIKALASGRGHYLIEIKKHNGKKAFRCYDKEKNIVGFSFNYVVVNNLIKKGHIILHKDKLYLK